MDDLVRWLGEQLDEDERIAREATPGPWRQHDTHLGQYGHTATVLSGEGNDTELRAWLPSMSQESWDETRNVWNDAVHIAQWDPARVLREIDAKRRIIREWEDAKRAADQDPTDVSAKVAMFAFEIVLRLEAAVLAARPGYRPEWTAGE